MEAKQNSFKNEIAQKRNDHLSSDDDDDDDTEEPDTAHVQLVSCIFTGDSYPSAHEYFVAMKEKFGFDIWQIVLTDLSLSFFSYVKLINYLRRTYPHKDPPTSSELAASKEEWDSDEYLKPVIEDDPLLQFILDDHSDFESDEDVLPEQEVADDSLCSGECGAEIYFLKHQLRKKEKENEKLSQQLAEAANQISKMKSFMQDVIITGDVGIYRPVAACRKDLQDYEDEEYEDSGYFGTYSHHDIHSEMLQDKIRTLSYKNAIMSNADIFKGKIVLDVGCGTGILSMFASRAGASHVYGIDMSEIAFQAMEIVRENGLQDKITILKGRVEEISLPVSKVDIIVSEWMGYFLLYESMLDSVLFARDKWLSPSGVMLPSRCTVSLQAAHDERLQGSHVSFWDDVYGFQMSCLKKDVLSEGSIQVLNPNCLVSDPVLVHDIDIGQVQTKELNYKCDFELPITKTGFCSAIVGYFDVYEGDVDKNKLMFSTSPKCHPTHWKQTLFFLKETIEVKNGDKIPGKIDCRKNIKDPRSLIITLTINGKTQTYKIE